MSFVDEGKLRLEDMVGTYLPVLSAHGKGRITVRQCLSHLTGIREPPLRKQERYKELMQLVDAALL